MKSEATGDDLTGASMEPILQASNEWCLSGVRDKKREKGVVHDRRVPDPVRLSRFDHQAPDPSLFAPSISSASFQQPSQRQLFRPISPVVCHLSSNELARLLLQSSVSLFAAATVRFVAGLAGRGTAAIRLFYSQPQIPQEVYESIYLLIIEIGRI